VQYGDGILGSMAQDTRVLRKIYRIIFNNEELAFLANGSDRLNSQCNGYIVPFCRYWIC